MTQIRRMVLLGLCVAICGLALSAPTASAGLTCQSGAYPCLQTLLASGTQAGGTRLSVSIRTFAITCNFTASGNIQVASATSVNPVALNINDCVGPVGCDAPTVTVDAVSSWSLTLSSSTPTAPTSWPVQWGIGGAHLACGRNGTIDLASQDPGTCIRLTTTSRLTSNDEARPYQHLEVSCGGRFTATGSVSFIVGASGVLTITAVLRIASDSGGATETKIRVTAT